jgi:hypothetical protein
MAICLTSSDHLLDDSQVPGYAIVCIICGKLWRRGPRTQSPNASPPAAAAQPASSRPPGSPLDDLDDQDSAITSAAGARPPARTRRANAGTRSGERSDERRNERKPPRSASSEPDSSVWLDARRAESDSSKVPTRQGVSQKRRTNRPLSAGRPGVPIWETAEWKRTAELPSTGAFRRWRPGGRAG